jgi:NAD(P)-dependent dehydrogenase (short-subunit alcohol dehydrogenase family)
MTKTVVITGAGSGIGRAIANTLASKNYSLLLLGRDRSRLEKTREALNEPSKHKSFSCDIRNPDEIKKAITESGANNFYALIANAGVGGENHSGNQDRWSEIIETNLTGTYNTVQECIPYLKKNPAEFGKIIIISSILARLGVPGYTAYCASKAGLLGLTRSLANELAGEKILVNALLPGWVNTDMAHEGLQAFADALSISKESAYEKAMEEVPLRKMSEPEEVARMVSFLISEEQNSITGQTLDINNGAMMP